MVEGETLNSAAASLKLCKRAAASNARSQAKGGTAGILAKPWVIHLAEHFYRPEFYPPESNSAARLVP